MKQYKILFAFVGLMLLAGVPAQAQVVVKVKPIRPTVVVQRPAKLKAGHIWVEGHWRWDRRAKKYIWVKGHQIQARKGFRYVPGRWVSTRRGYKWVPGGWKRV